MLLRERNAGFRDFFGKCVLAVSVLWLCWFAFLQNAEAQTAARIAGRVFDAKSEAAIEAANVRLDGTDFGAATDRGGAFLIATVPPGRYRLEVRVLGYQTFSRQVTLEAGERAEIVVALEPTVISGEEVLIERRRVEDARLDISPATYDLDTRLIEAQAGAFEDVLRTVQTLPGVITPNDFSNQYIVRGGSPNQNLILMDGVELYSPYRRDGMASVFNPAIVQDVRLYAGGFPAIFGDRLSSVLAVTSRDGTTEKWMAGRFGSSLTNANLILEGKTPFVKGSWLLSARRSYYDLFARDFVRDLGIFNEVAFPDFQDFQAKVVLRPSSKHKIQFTGLAGQNNMDYLAKEEVGEQISDNPALDGDDRMDNTILGAAWTFTPSPRVQTRVFANRYQNSGSSDLGGNLASAGIFAGKNFLTGEIITTAPPGGQADTLTFQFNQRYDFNKFSLGNWWIYAHDRHTLEFGIAADFAENALASTIDLDAYGETLFSALSSAPNFFGALAGAVDQRQIFTRTNLYLQDKILLDGEALWLQPGLRFDHYGNIDKSYVSPRLNLFWQLRPTSSLRLATGLYRQSPGYEKLLDGGRIFDLLQFASLHDLRAEKAWHLIAGITETLRPDVRLSIEAYYKNADGLVVQDVQVIDQPAPVHIIAPGTAPAMPSAYRIETRSVLSQTPTPANLANVAAYGIDLFLEKTRQFAGDRWHGSLAFSIGKATQKQHFPNADGSIATVSFPYDYDRRFSAKAALFFDAGAGVQLSANWQYGSGFPHTPAVRVEPLIGFAADTMLVDGEPVIEETPFVLADPATGYARFIPDFGPISERNGARLPAYHRLDLRLSYSGKIGSAPFSVYADFINVYNRKNVFQYQPIIYIEGDDPELPLALRFPKPVLALRPVYMLPFVPSLGFSVSF